MLDVFEENFREHFEQGVKFASKTSHAVLNRCAGAHIEILFGGV